MKKANSYLLFLFILFSFLSTKSSCQPVILNASNFPSAGVVYSVDHIQDTTGMAATGPNCMWGFDKVVVNNLGTLTIQNPSSTPFYSTYSTADFSFSQNYASTFYDYLINEPTKLQCIGNAIDLGTGLGQDYTPNAQTWLKFPFNFGDTISDTYHEVGANAETLFLKYDGFGTLYLPTVTYSDVVRIKMEYSFGTEIMWWRTNPLFPVMYYKLNIPTLYCFTPINTTSVNDNSLATLELFPNPSEGNFNIKCKNEKIEYVNIYNIIGECVLQFQIINTEYNINMKGYRSGIYFIELVSKDKNKVYKKIVIK